MGMKLFKIISAFTTAAALFSLAPGADLNACTGIRLTAKDGSIVHGRTLEFGTYVETGVIVIPRGYEFKGTTPNGDGLAYKAKYGVVGSMTFDTPLVMDGMNEKGLAVGTFYFPGFAGYTPTTAENISKSLSSIDFPNWIVTQFATIEEVKAALSSVVIAPTVIKAWGNTPPPFHYIVYDQKGGSLVIEPMNGQLVTYDNPLGVFTNSPSFDWHLTNLRNYINLSPLNAKEITVNGLHLSAFGQGSGMVGLPGDFTPPSRFVRAAIFSETALPTANAEEAIFQLFHILNQFDIPKGVAREDVDGKIYADYTMVTCARDPQSLRYYIKTYQDQSIKVVDLKSFDLNAKEIKRENNTGVQKAIDISASLK